MATVLDNDKEFDGQKIAWVRMYDRLSPLRRKTLARCARRIVDGMPFKEAAQRLVIELGGSEAEAGEEVAKALSDTSGRWQDSLD
jgi:hypothetical protein